MATTQATATPQPQNPTTTARVEQVRRPAYSTKCDHCHRPNHFATVCHRKTKPPQQHNDPQHEGAIFDALCTTTSSAHKAGRGAIALDHHLYNHLRDQWVRKPSKAQPLSH